jgi:hypothetical protein
MNELKDYILVINNALPHSLCDNILKEYSKMEEWKVSEVNNGDNKSIIKKKIRNCLNIFISDKNVINNNESVRQNIDKKIFLSVGKIIKKYTKKYNNCFITSDTGYVLLKYKKNNFYKDHVDSSNKDIRKVSCSIVINDNFKGGEFSFFKNSILYSLKKGSAIIFPSNFLYPHSILPVTKGERCSIVTWFY